MNLKVLLVMFFSWTLSAQATSIKVDSCFEEQNTLACQMMSACTSSEDTKILCSGLVAVAFKDKLFSMEEVESKFNEYEVLKEQFTVKPFSYDTKNCGVNVSDYAQQLSCMMSNICVPPSTVRSVINDSFGKQPSEDDFSLITSTSYFCNLVLTTSGMKKKQAKKLIVKQRKFLQEQIRNNVDTPGSESTFFEE